MVLSFLYVHYMWLAFSSCAVLADHFIEVLIRDFGFQGPPNKTKTCQTCNGDFKQCPGHFGYLHLALPVYNVGYLTTIVDILKCICKVCEALIVTFLELLFSLQVRI